MDICQPTDLIRTQRLSVRQTNSGKMGLIGFRQECKGAGFTNFGHQSSL
jgi:hypothetical protein